MDTKSMKLVEKMENCNSISSPKTVLESIFKRMVGFNLSYDSALAACVHTEEISNMEKLYNLLENDLADMLRNESRYMQMRIIIDMIICI